MIELYAKGTTDFSKHGIALAARQASVTYQDNGRYDMDMTMPYNANINIDYGMILRCPVPKQEIGQITLGTVSYWEVSSGQADVPLYSEIPTLQRVSYQQWNANRAAKIYAVGEKCTYNRQNYRMTALDPGENNYNHPPDNYPEYWTEISNWSWTAGKVAATLQAGDDIVKTGDFNSEYMKAADTAGHEGFIQISKCTDLSETGTRTVPAQTITLQSFTITEITKSSDGKSLTIHAEHISYQLQRTMLGECNISRANPATALMFIRGAMKESYPGEIETNLPDSLVITGDYSWKNAQAAILDPKAGILQATNGRIIRNDLNVYIIAEGEPDPRYRITYGTNMKAVKWDGNVGDLVTRIYPLAQNEDGSTLLLPEEYIDTVRTVPYIRPEALNTGLKVGQKEKQEDGSEITLDVNTVYTRMREAANNRFNIDEADKATVTLDVDWQHLPDTAEYSAYAALANAAPGEWVRVTAGPLGISTDIQLTGYTWDPIMGRYQKGTFGKQKVSSGVAAYDIQSGAVTGRVLAAGAVSGQNLQAGTITAREIEANSITSDKIASKSITAELIMAGAVTADEIAALAITTEKLAAGAVTAGKIAAHTITSDEILAGGITTAALAAGAVTAEIIASSAVTTEKLAASAVTANKIDALAVTTEKLAAGAVTAEKIGAGSITAAKIDTTDLSAIQATLQIASIASAQIASADINYAHVKDLDAQSAYFGQAVFQEALGGKLYVPRLAANYAQILNATISDLVIQASNDNFYKLDIDLSGNVTATQVTPSAAEIAQGHTSDGRTIYMGTDILADDLNTQNIYASHALMDEITANIINVDKLWAREAFISKLNLQDLSSNNYIRSTIGNWQSGSTITQEIDSLDSRIASLGYGTVYMQPNEPSHSELVSGDIWIQTMTDGSWQEIYDDYSSWNEIYNNVSTWQVLGSIPIMWVWDGRRWQQMYDALLPTSMETEIQQLATAITLKASQSAVDILSGEVSEFAATLAIQADEIEAAVSAVNAKAASYVMWADPRTLYSVSLGDIWVKRDTEGFNDTSTWQTVYEDFASWQALYDMHDSWGDMLGDRTYVWNGSAWIETSDRAAEVYQKTLIDQTSTSVTILAETSAQLGDDVVILQAGLTVANDRITQEVSRATAAEAGKIEKTTQYQTADAIVSEAVSQSASSASGLYLQKTTQYQTADSIVSEAVSQAASAASGAYIAKSGIYQSADSIKTEAVRVSGVNAAALYMEKTNTYSTVDDIINKSQAQADAAADTAKNASIAKTSTYQSAQAIVNTAVAQAATAAGQAYIAKTNTYQTADAIVSTAERYADTAAATAESNAKTYAATQASAAETRAKNASIAKTETYQSAAAIVNTAETYADGAASAAETNAKNASIAKATGYSSVSDIIAQAESLASAAETNAKNASIARTTLYQSANAIVAAAEAYTDNNAYALVSGITITAAGVDISGSQYVKIASGGYFQVKTGNFGIDTNSSGICIWAGASTAANSYFRVSKDGTVYLTKLVAIGEAGTETNVNLNTAGLWKLNYQTIKSHTANSLTLSNGDVVNFTKASDLSIGTGGGGTVYILKDGSQYGTASGSVAIKANANSYSINTTTGDLLVLADVMLNGTDVIRANDSTLINILSELQAQFNAGKASVSATSAEYTGSPTASARTLDLDVGLSSGVTTHHVTLNVGTWRDVVFAAGQSDGAATGRETGWTAAYGKCGNSMSGGKLEITRPGQTYNSQVTDKYKVAGLYAYSRAGQTAYTYEQGQLVSFTIPSDCKTGSAYITTDT